MSKITPIKAIHLSFERILKYKTWQQPAGNPQAFPAGNPPPAVVRQQLPFSFPLSANTREGLSLESPLGSTSRSTLQLHSLLPPRQAPTAEPLQTLHQATNTSASQPFSPTCFFIFPTSLPLLPFLPRPLYPPQVKAASKQKAIQQITRDEMNSTALQECSIIFFPKLIHKIHSLV